MHLLLNYKRQEGKYLVLFLIGLLVANFTIKTIYPNPAIWLTSTIFLILYSFIFFINKADISYFIIFIIVGCHFTIAPNQGGLFNLLAVLGLTIKLFSGRRGIYYSIAILPKLLKLLFIVLILSNFISTIFFNTGTFAEQVFGILSFLSCILFFFFAMDNAKYGSFSLLLKVIVVLAGYNLIIALNQRFFGIYLNTPLAPLVIQSEGYQSTNSSGTFGSSALFGEFYLLTFIFLVFSRYLGIGRSVSKSRLMSIGIIFSLFNVLLSNSRSVLILAATSSLILLLIMISKKKSIITLLRFLIIIAVFIAAGLLFGLFDVIGEKMNNISIQSLTVGSIISGEDINRGIIFSNAVKRLAENSWLLGHGYGVFETNANAWFGEFGFSFYGKGHEIYDIHNLYLGLPMLFGWFGAFSYIGIILYILLRLLSSLKHQNDQSYGIFAGLTVLWLVFLINEYKVNAIALPHYHLLIWILLGYSYGIVFYNDEIEI